MQKHLVFVLCLAGMLSCEDVQKNKASTEESKSFTAPTTTFLVDLPDSLQPRVVDLQKMPAPQVVPLPKVAGGSYRYINESGIASTIPLIPSTQKSLPLVLDERGQPIRDASGKPILMGNKGISPIITNDSELGSSLGGGRSGLFDQFGNLWIGSTGTGILKFDGTQFVNFTVAQGLAHNSISSIMEDKTGNLWIGSDGGVSCYDGWSITNFTIEQGLVNNFVKCILQDSRGYIWFGTAGGGLSLYNPDPAILPVKKRFTNFNTEQGLLHNDVICIYEDKQGCIWFGTSAGACKFDPSALGKSRPTNLNPFKVEKNLINKSINSITQDHQGNYWFGTNTGLYKYDGKAFTNFNTKQGLIGNNVIHITCDSSDNLWISARNAGISKYDGKTFLNFTSEQGLPNNDVQCTILSKTGTPWFGNRLVNPAKYSGDAFIQYTREDGLVSDAIFTILEDKDKNFWFGSESSGLVRFDGRIFTHYNENQGLSGGGIFSATVDSTGNLWVGSINGIYRFDGKVFSHFTMEQGLPNLRINCAIVTKENISWFGTPKGLVKYDGRSFTIFNSSQGLPSNYILSLAIDKMNNLWIGTLEGGVSKFDGKSFTNYSTDQGLVYNDVYSITCDKSGNLWFGTDSGVSRISSKKLAELSHHSDSKRDADQTIFDNFTTANGLANDVIYDIEEDRRGNIMIGTNLGITLIPAEATKLPFAQVRPKLEYYNVPNGYPIKDVNTSALYCDSQGYMWIGTSAGLFRFNHDAIPKNKIRPSLVLEKIKVNEQDVCWFDLQRGGIYRNQTDSARALFAETLIFGKMLTQVERDTFLRPFKGIRFDSISRFYSIPQKLILPHQNNHIAIHYKAIDTDHAQQLQYQYQLEGYDKTWSQATQATNASFGNMSAGKYTFKVRVRRGNEEWSTPLSYSFRVLPPWYLSWWAYVLYALIIWASLREFIKWRGRALIREKEKLEKAVQERTNELSQRLEELATVNQVSKGLVSQLQLDELFRLVGDEMRRLFKANIVYIAVHEKASNMIHFPYEYGDSTPSRIFGNGLTEKIIRSKGPLLLNEDSRVRNKELNVDTLGQSSKSYLGVPIIAADEVIGVLSVQSTQQENRFKDDDLRLLNTIAANVGVAMHNAQLFEEAQQARAQAEEANEAKSSFLSTISHELRTPLTSVIGFAKIIRKRLEEKIFPLVPAEDNKVQRSIEQVSDNLKVVISEGERLTNLINDVLDLAKIESGRVDWKMEKVSIEALIERAKAVTSSLFTEKNLGLTSEVQAGLPSVIADHDRMLQVLINLLSNAVKFTKQGTVKIKAKQEPTQLVVSITDSGIGIAPEDQVKVFEKFKQAGDTLTDKPKGTGLGLPICKEIVEHHGGQLWLESELGKGSTFYFSLPLDVE